MNQIDGVVTGQGGAVPPAGGGAVPGWLNGISLNGLFSDNGWEKWLILLVLIVAGVTAGRVVSALLRRAALKKSEGKEAFRQSLADSAAGPLNLALITGGLAMGLLQLRLSEHLLSFVHGTITLLIYVVAFWFAFNLVSLVELALKRFASRAETRLHTMVVPLIRRSLRIFVVIVGGLIILNNVFGQNVGAWLAGLGIVGLGVSLAAQDSLKNLFGSITILLDHPFRPGERIVFSGFDGPVEEIGFRSIKIRTLTGHLVTIPNSKVVSEAVENIGARPYIRHVMTVTITYDTPAEKVQEAVDIVKRLFEEKGLKEPIHGRVGADEFPPRVYFSGYGDWALRLMILYWHFPPVYWDYMEHAQRFNLRLLQEFNRAGISFAFPSETVFLAGDLKSRLAAAPPAPAHGRARPRRR